MDNNREPETIEEFIRELENQEAQELPLRSDVPQAVYSDPMREDTISQESGETAVPDRIALPDDAVGWLIESPNLWELIFTDPRYNTYRIGYVPIPDDWDAVQHTDWEYKDVDIFLEISDYSISYIAQKLGLVYLNTRQLVFSPLEEMDYSYIKYNFPSTRMQRDHIILTEPHEHLAEYFSSRRKLLGEGEIGWFIQRKEDWIALDDSLHQIIVPDNVVPYAWKFRYAPIPLNWDGSDLSLDWKVVVMVAFYSRDENMSIEYVSSKINLGYRDCGVSWYPPTRLGY